MTTFNNYEIYVTEQNLPSLEEPWTNIEINDKTYSFKRTKNTSKPFNISGYIRRDTYTDTYNYATQLNDDLNTSPSGTFTDGYGTQFTCIVDDWDIDIMAVKNKATFSMTLRIVS